MTRQKAEPLRGLVIDQPYVDWILSGRKTWEIRGKATKLRGCIALIAKGTGTVVGTCNLIDVRGPLKLAELKANAKRQNRKPADIRSPLYYGNHTYAWVLSGARRLRTPLTYQHPSGAVVWVKLNAHVTTKLRDASQKRSRRKLARTVDSPVEEAKVMNGYRTRRRQMRQTRGEFGTPHVANVGARAGRNPGREPSRDASPIDEGGLLPQAGGAA